MAQAPQSFTDMFKNLGEQLKLPQVDVAKIMEHHQKNLDAMTRSWQAMASGAGEVAKKQRAIFEETVKDVTEMAKEYKPGGSPQEIMAKQSEFAKKAMEAAIAATPAHTPHFWPAEEDRVSESEEAPRQAILSASRQPCSRRQNATL